jgi:hypothetical protein
MRDIIVYGRFDVLVITIIQFSHKFQTVPFIFRLRIFDFMFRKVQHQDEKLKCFKHREDAHIKSTYFVNSNQRKTSDSLA